MHTSLNNYIAVKDSAANLQNIRTEEIELIDEDDVPPPVPDTPRRIQFDRTYDAQQTIPEDQETGQNNFRSKLKIKLRIIYHLSRVTTKPT
jgi:hypothetical protein